MNSNMICIPSHIQDPNYRYKMPKLVIIGQGSGGGPKSNIENIQAVADALQIAPDCNTILLILYRHS